MNKSWQNNSWIAAIFFAVYGATGILQAYLDSKHQPDALFVPALILSSLVLGIGLLLLAMYRVNVRKSRKLGSGTGDTSPDCGDSASAMALRATGNDKLTNWMRKDEIILVAAISVFILGILKVGVILDDILSYKIPVTMMPISMIIAGLYLGCSVLFFTAYVRRKRKPRSKETPPRLARSRGQPKEAREE
jgi:hypothetical protein